MHIVYLIQNCETWKYYVGTTTESLHRRWQKHCALARNETEKRPLYEDIRAYGEDRWVLKEIERVKDSFLVSKRETFWIKELDCAYPKGYNVAKTSSYYLRTPGVKAQAELYS